MRTPLHVLAAPLYTVTGQMRFYNLLDRQGFRCVEDVAAIPDGCLLDLRNVGLKFLAVVRAVIADLHLEGTDTADEAGATDLAARSVQSAPLPGVAVALQALAAWAQAECGGRSLGDVLGLADGIVGLPPDIARAWDRITGRSVRSLAGPPAEDLACLAEELLQQVDQRRRLILTAHTFAGDRRSYGSLAAELGVSPERVRQLEQSACDQLALVMVGDRYAPLRWRTLSAAPSVVGTWTAPPWSPPWTGGLLAWLAQRMKEPGRPRRPRPSDPDPQPPVMVQVQQSPPHREEDENKPIELSDDAKRLALLVDEEEARLKARRLDH